MNSTTLSPIQPHNERPAAVWSSGGAHYDAISRGIADSIEHGVLRLDPKPGERILDLSTGTGWTSRVVARHGATVIGVDIANDLLESARRRADAEGLRIEYRLGDAEGLPFEDGAFDAVISTYGVMFASRPEAAAAELARVCRKGGRIALTTWAPDGNVFNMFGVMKRYMPAPAAAAPPSPFAWGSIERVRELLGDAFELRFERGRGMDHVLERLRSDQVPRDEPGSQSSRRVPRRFHRVPSNLRDGVGDLRSARVLAHSRCPMKSALIRLSLLALVIVGVQPAATRAQSTTSPAVPPVPANLEVPAGNELFLATRAVGTQNYVCITTAKRTVGWKFLGPQATVFVDVDGGVPQQATTHFLSMNPTEVLARPTWQHSVDTSKVWGRVRASSADPNYVAPGAIPWLLLETAGAEFGPTGGGFMTQTTFIQRVNTSGGIAPSTGCTNDDQIGAVALVPYTTDYFFYRAIQQ
jgi:SAM-dependent methyltransferase